MEQVAKEYGINVRKKIKALAELLERGLHGSSSL